MKLKIRKLKNECVLEIFVCLYVSTFSFYETILLVLVYFGLLAQKKKGCQRRSR